MLLGELARIGLDLMPASSAPEDKPQLGLGRVAERHRRAGFGFHCRPDVRWLRPELTRCSIRAEISNIEPIGAGGAKKKERRAAAPPLMRRNAA